MLWCPYSSITHFISDSAQLKKVSCLQNPSTVGIVLFECPVEACRRSDGLLGVKDRPLCILTQDSLTKIGKVPRKSNTVAKSHLKCNITSSPQELIVYALIHAAIRMRQTPFLGSDVCFKVATSVRCTYSEAELEFISWPFPLLL